MIEIKTGPVTYRPRVNDYADDIADKLKAGLGYRYTTADLLRVIAAGVRDGYKLGYAAHG